MSQTTRKVFFNNSLTGESNTGAEQEMSFGHATLLFHTLTAPGSFLGVELPDGATLQLARNDDGSVYLELLSKNQVDTSSAIVQPTVAEEAIRAAFSTTPIQLALAPHFVRWKNGNAANPGL